MRVLCLASGAAAGFACLVAGGPATAYPDGAPWGSADPDTFQSCASCHFDHEPVGRSAAIMVAGLPEYATPGEVYEATLRFDAGAAQRAGFLLSASSGAFDAVDAFVETAGGQLRSVKPSTVDGTVDGTVAWSIVWRADDAGEPVENGVVVFHAAILGANDDASAFGDRLHFRKFVIPVRPGAD